MARSPTLGYPRVMCVSCFGRQSAPTIDEAIAAWNRRAEAIILPLQWVWDEAKRVRIAESLLGKYWIKQQEGTRETRFELGYADGGAISVVPSIERAMALAQADYDKRRPEILARAGLTAQSEAAVVVLVEDGTVLVPEGSPLKEIMDALPKPLIGTKCLPLYARTTPLDTDVPRVCEDAHPEDGRKSTCDKCGYYYDSIGGCMCATTPPASAQPEAEPLARTEQDIFNLGYGRVIDIEKLLLAKLGREWTPGISIVSLIDELASRSAPASGVSEAYERGFFACRGEAYLIAGYGKNSEEIARFIGRLQPNANGVAK